MSYERGEPYFDMYSNTPKSVNDEIKSILRRTELQNETRHTIFEPSPSSYYKETENESNWRNVDSRKESAHISAQGSYASTIASMPIFTEDNSDNISSNFQSSKFPKSINAELYAKALAVKSDLGLLPDSSNQSSSALESIQSYGPEFQNSPPATPYQQGWRPREYDPSHRLSATAVEQHYHSKTFSPLRQASSKVDLSNELFEQMKSMICSSNPIDSPKPLSGSSYRSSNPIGEPKTSGSINLIPGFSSIEDEDQFLYGDSDTDKPVEVKDVRTYDSQSKNKEGEWSHEDLQIVNEVTSSKVVADTLKSGRSASSKSDKSMTSDEFHAIDLKLQPNVWKNPSIWDMPSGDDVYGHAESGKRSKKEEALFDVKHDRNKRQKLDPPAKHTDTRRSNVDRDKTSHEHVEREKRFPVSKSSMPIKQHDSLTSDKKAGASDQNFDRFQKQAVASDKSFKEKVLPLSHLDQKSNSKKFVPNVVEKISQNPVKQYNLMDPMAENKSKFHYAAELLKTRCTKAVFEAETSAGFNSPKATRECSEDMSAKFEKAEFAVKQEEPDSPELLTSADKKTMEKLLINVGQGETFSAKRTVRVKNQSSTSKEAEILGSMVQDFIKQSEMSDKSAFNLQHHRIVRSIKNDNSLKCMLNESSKSPEKNLYPSLGSRNLNIPEQKYASSFNPIKDTKSVSKDRSRRSRSKEKKSPKKHSTRSSRSSSSDSNSSRTHSSDSYSSRGSRKHSRKSQSPKRFSRDNTSPRRKFSPSPRRSRDNHSPNRRSRIPKHYSRNSFSPSPSFNSRSSTDKKNRFTPHGRRSRSPRKYSQKSSDKYYKRKSRDRSPLRKTSDKVIVTKSKALKDAPNMNQNLPIKLEQLTSEKGAVKVKSESKLSSNLLYDESTNILPSFRVESSKVVENISSLPYDESLEPDEKVAELAAFLKEIQQRRKLDNISQFTDSQNLMENKIISIDSTIPPTSIPLTHLSPQPPQYVEMNQENIDERMFFQQQYQYNSPVLTNVAQYPGMNNYPSYPNPNIPTQDIRSMYNSYNIDVPQQLGPYFPENDQIKLQVTQRFNKPSSVRVCNLKEVPVVVNNNNIQLLPTTEIKQQKPEIKQTNKDAIPDKIFTGDNKESKRKEFVQKKVGETSNKDSQNEELYKKLLEIKDSIQKKIEGTQNDMEELQRIKVKAEKKMRRTRNLSDKQNVVQTTELLEQVQEELNILHQQAKEVDKEVTSARLKIVEEKIKNSRPVPEVPKIGVEPIKFKISNIDQAKAKVSKVESKSEMLKNEPVKQNEKKANDPDVKLKIEPVPVIPQVKYSCYDCGSHWCQPCNQQYPSIPTMLDHMHKSEHKKHDTSVKPWSKDVESKQEINPFNSAMHPVKGIEFISPVEGFYCSLCKETFPDKLASEKHLKGHEHTDKYFKYVKENPSYERRYNLSKTAGLSIIYKERKKKAMEEQSLIKKEADMKIKKMMQREKKFEKKDDELDETNLNMSNSPNDHKSSGIKLTLVNEKEKTKAGDSKKKENSSDAKPKQQLVFIGRAPNFKLRTNTKTDLKNRIENLNKRKADQMQGPSQSTENIPDRTKSESEPERTSSDPKVVQNLDTKQMAESVVKSKYPVKKSRWEQADLTSSQKDKSTNDAVSKASTGRSDMSSSSKTSSVASNQLLSENKVAENRSTYINKIENVNPVIVESIKKTPKQSHSKYANLVAVPLHEINLPSVPSKKTYTTEKLSSKSDPSLPVNYSEPIPPVHAYNQNAKTPIHKVKQNVLLSEEEQDFLLLGINKADMAPLAVPRPPPSSLIQIHERPEIEVSKKSDNEALPSSPQRTRVKAETKSPTVVEVLKTSSQKDMVKAETKLSPIVVEVLKKNIPPFPPPIQVPPPTLAIQSQNLPPFPPPIQVPPPSLALKNKFNEAILSLESKTVSREGVVPIAAVVADVKSSDQNFNNAKPLFSMSANNLLKATSANVASVNTSSKGPLLKQDLTANKDETTPEILKNSSKQVKKNIVETSVKKLSENNETENKDLLLLKIGEEVCSEISKEKELEEEVLIIEEVSGHKQSLHVSKRNNSENHKIHETRISDNDTITSSKTSDSEVSSESVIEKNSVVDDNIVSIHTAPLSDEIQIVHNEEICIEENSGLSKDEAKTVSNEVKNLSKEGSVICVPLVDVERSSSNVIKEISSDKCEIEILNSSVLECAESSGSAVSDAAVVQTENNLLQTECVTESDDLPLKKKVLKSTELSIPDELILSSESLHQSELGTNIFKEKYRSNLISSVKSDTEASADPNIVIDSISSVRILEGNSALKEVNTMKTIDIIKSIDTLEENNTVRKVNAMETETSDIIKSMETETSDIIKSMETETSDTIKLIDTVEAETSDSTKSIDTSHLTNTDETSPIPFTTNLTEDECSLKMEDTDKKKTVTEKDTRNSVPDVEMEDIDDGQSISTSVAYDSDGAGKVICSRTADEESLDISASSTLKDNYLPKSVECCGRELEPEGLVSVKSIHVNESVGVQEPINEEAQVCAISESVTNTSTIEKFLLKNETVSQQDATMVTNLNDSIDKNVDDKDGSVDNVNVCRKNENVTDVKGILILEESNSEPSEFSTTKRRLEDMKTTKELDAKDVLESDSIKEEMLKISENRSNEKYEHQASISENLKISEISENLEFVTEKHGNVANVMESSTLTSVKNLNSERDTNISRSDASVEEICNDKPIDAIESADSMPLPSAFEVTLNRDAISEEKTEVIDMKHNMEITVIDTLKEIKFDSFESLNTIKNQVCEMETEKTVEECSTELQCATLSENIENKDVFDVHKTTKENTAAETSTVNSQNEGQEHNTAITKPCLSELSTLCSENIVSNESTVKNEEDEMCSKSSAELLQTSDNLVKETINDVACDKMIAPENSEKFLVADLKCDNEDKIDVKETVAEDTSLCSVKSQDPDLKQDLKKLDDLIPSLMMEQDDSNLNTFDNEGEKIEKTIVVTSEIPENAPSLSSITCVSNETNEDKITNNISVAESEKQIILPSSDIESNSLDSSIKESSEAVSFVPCLEKFDVNDSALNEDLSSDPPVLNEVPENEQKIEDETLSKEHTGQVEKDNKHSAAESVLQNVNLKEDAIDEQILNREIVADDADTINNLIQNFLLFSQENASQDSCETKKEEIGDMKKEKSKEFKEDEIEEIEKEVKYACEQKNETHHFLCEETKSDMKCADETENEKQQISCEKLEDDPKDLIQQEMTEQKKAEEPKLMKAEEPELKKAEEPELKKAEETELGISKNQQSVIQDSSPGEKSQTVKKSHGSNDSDTDEYETETDT